MESGPKIQVMAAITAMSAIWNVVKDFFFVVVTADMIISSLKCIVKNKTSRIYCQHKINNELTILPRGVSFAIQVNFLENWHFAQIY